MNGLLLSILVGRRVALFPSGPAEISNQQFPAAYVSLSHNPIPGSSLQGRGRAGLLRRNSAGEGIKSLPTTVGSTGC